MEKSAAVLMVFLVYGMYASLLKLSVASLHSVYSVFSCCGEEGDLFPGPMCFLCLSSTGEVFFCGSEDAASAIALGVFFLCTQNLWTFCMVSCI